MKQHEKYNLLVWKKTVNNYPKSTACIINSKYEVIDTIDMIFSDSGEFSIEYKNKIPKYKDNGLDLYSCFNHGHILNIDGSGNIEVELNPTQAAEVFKKEQEHLNKIDSFLTKEKTDELINLFRKDNNTKYSE